MLEEVSTKVAGEEIEQQQSKDMVDEVAEEEILDGEVNDEGQVCVMELSMTPDSLEVKEVPPIEVKGSLLWGICGFIKRGFGLGDVEVEGKREL